MTTRTRNAIKKLYFFHRYTKTSIGKVLGISRVRVHAILTKEKIVVLNPDFECLICGAEPALLFYIDGNPNNENPQNVIMLCNYDSNIIKELQLKKGNGVITTEV